MDFRLLQLADSAYPVGGFAHSAGLEAHAAHGFLADGELDAFTADVAWQAGFASFPLIRAAREDFAPLPELCATCDAFLTNPIANRASRTQGRAFVTTSARVFAEAAHLEAVAKTLPAHHAPIFGAVMRAIDVSTEDACAIFLHGAVRGVLSAAVRLGLAGPHESQRIHDSMRPLLARILAECTHLTLENLAQPAPLLEMRAQLHDALYSRLFQS